MNEKAMIEKIVKEILLSMDAESQTLITEKDGDSDRKSSERPGRLTAADYPIASKRPELVKTLTNMSMNDITLESVLSGGIKPQDIKISDTTLEMQAQIAESAGRSSFARNLRRAAELTLIPDERILEIYNALRPYRSTKQDLLEIADELETVYNAKITGEFVKEAAEVYETRGRLLTEQ